MVGPITAANFPFAPPPIPKDDDEATLVPPSSRRASLWDVAKDYASNVATTVESYAKAPAPPRPQHETFWPTSLDLESSKAARILRTFTMDAVDLPDEALLDVPKHKRMIKKIPPTAISHAQGLAIFTLMRTGILTTGAAGSGVLIARLSDGSWSAPSGVLLHTLGFGIVSGPDVYDVVLVLRTSKALQSLTKPRAPLGGDVSIATGPVGNALMLETGVESAPIWSYVKSRGEYGSVKVDGNMLIERNDENERCYGRRIKSSEILAGDVKVPYWSNGLIQTILAAEGKNYDLDQIPTGTSPSDIITTSNGERRSSLLDERRASVVPLPVPASPAPPPPPSAAEKGKSTLNLQKPTTSWLPTTPPELPIKPIQFRTSFQKRPLSLKPSFRDRRLPTEELDDDDLAARKEMEETLRSFGIEDPAINEMLRKDDPNLLRDLDNLTTPPLSATGSSSFGTYRSQSSRSSSVAGGPRSSGDPSSPRSVRGNGSLSAELDQASSVLAAAFEPTSSALDDVKAEKHSSWGEIRETNGGDKKETPLPWIPVANSPTRRQAVIVQPQPHPAAAGSVEDEMPTPVVKQQPSVPSTPVQKVPVEQLKAALSTPKGAAAAVADEQEDSGSEEEVEVTDSEGEEEESEEEVEVSESEEEEEVEESESEEEVEEVEQEEEQEEEAEEKIQQEETVEQIIAAIEAEQASAVVEEDAADPSPADAVEAQNKSVDAVDLVTKQAAEGNNEEESSEGEEDDEEEEESGDDGHVEDHSSDSDLDEHLLDDKTTTLEPMLVSLPRPASALPAATGALSPSDLAPMTPSEAGSETESFEEAEEGEGAAGEVEAEAEASPEVGLGVSHGDVVIDIDDWAYDPSQTGSPLP